MRCESADVWGNDINTRVRVHIRNKKQSSLTRKATMKRRRTPGRPGLGFEYF